MEPFEESYFEIRIEFMTNSLTLTEVGRSWSFDDDFSKEQVLRVPAEPKFALVGKGLVLCSSFKFFA